MSFLYFDYDRSTASIGGKKGVEDKLGLPPVEMDGGVTRFRKTMERLVTVETIQHEHPVLGTAEDPEKKMVLNERAKDFGVQGIVIDTITRLGENELQATKERMNDQRKAEGDDPLDNLTRTWWGNYGDMMLRFGKFLSKLPFTVVATAHESVETDDVGKRYHGISMKGGASDKLYEYFDVAGYCGVDGEGHDKDRFLRVADSPAYPQAKDRKKLLDPRIPFVVDGELRDETLAGIIGLYRDEGIEYPDVFIIGQSGTGKTLLTGTLAPLC